MRVPLTMVLSRAILALTGIVFLGFGLAFTLFATPMAALAGIALPTPSARVDVMATYGGFELGFGAFLLLCLRRATWLEPGLWAGMLALGGFAAVRLLGLVMVGGAVSAAIYLALALEMLGTALNAWALSRDRVR